ncbi:MAG TPA: TlpA disulfide reductase family protein [Candidatus Nanopelagicales bacterium]
MTPAVTYGPPARRALVAVLALLALVLAGCSSSPDQGTGYDSADGSTVILAAADRDPAPVVVGTTLTGTTLDLAQWRGKVVVVNFWASWCVPCRDEAATLAQVSGQLKDKDVQFVGVVTRDTVDNAKAFLRTYPLSYPSLFDDPTNNSILLAFRGTLPVANTPTTYVLDRQGRIAARALGAVDRSRLLGLIDPVLDEKPA